MFDKSLQVFFERARLAHETFATYLSIKSLPYSAESQFLSELTPEYLGYFQRWLKS